MRSQLIETEPGAFLIKLHGHADHQISPIGDSKVTLIELLFCYSSKETYKVHVKLC